MKTPLIHLKNVSLSFGEKNILNDINLSIYENEKIAIIGESSSGKSTLLKLIVGLVKPQEGEVNIFEKNILKLNEKSLRETRKKIGMQFQSGALFDSYTILENLVIALEETDNKVDKNEILNLLKNVGLSSAALKKPHELSGGMRKRAALARALIINPQISIFDEPTAGLDPVTSKLILNLIKSLQHSSTMLLATTDIETAREFSNNFILIGNKTIKFQGSLEQLKEKEDPFIKKFLSRLL